MSIIAGIFYGLLSGITEFFPVSSRAHQALLLHLTGRDSRDPLQDLLVHIAILVCLTVLGRKMLPQMRAERNYRSVRRTRKGYSTRASYDSRLVRTAATPLVIGSLLYIATGRFEQKLPVLTVFLILNGLILLFADHVRQGNRDASTMSGLDGIIMGVCGALSSFPGVSRTGMITAYGVVRGADQQHATNWAILLAIPATAIGIVLDFVSLLVSGTTVTSFVPVIGYILGAGGAFLGAYLGITLLRVMLSRSGFSGFAYYSLGAALFSFILYLII